MTATDPTATDLAARVRAAVDAAFDDAVELLQELVAIDSTNPSFPGIDATAAAGGEARCVALLEQRYLALGLSTQRVAPDPARPNLVATLGGAGDGPALVLNGHVDTVPPVRRETWTMADPWAPERRGGELLGLGSTDMKGGLAAGWLAVRALRDAGVTLAGDLCVQCVVGEEQQQHEIGTSAATAAALAALGLAEGARPDAERIGAIVLEPSSTPEPLSLSPLSAGNHVFRVTIDGRATHAGNRGEAVRPGGAGGEVGVNAVEKALLIVRALQELEQEWGQTRSHPAFAPGFFTINPGALHADAGTPSPAYLADRAELDVLAWYPPDESAEEVRAELEWRIATAAALDPWLRDHPPRIDWLGNWPAASTPWEAPVVQALARAREQVTGEPTPPPGVDHRSGFAAVTDASFLEAAGIPAVVFGPGDLRRAHSADEGIELEQLRSCAAAVALAAIDFCGVAP